jgi:sec-independent protein translocase protein TatC
MAESDDPGDETRDDDSVSTDEAPMGFLDHLEELRWTLIKSFIAFAVAFVIAAFFFDRLADVLRWPLDRGLREHPESFKAVTNTPMAIFSVYIAIPMIGAVTLALPFVLYFIGQFVSPALKAKEKRLLIPGFFIGILLFLAGALFSYFLLVPSVVQISVELNTKLGSELYWTIDNYYSMLMWMMIGMGVAFQFPLLIQVLVFLDMVSVTRLRSWRRIMFIGCCIVAAFITPTPDPFNMMLVALPLYFLYEAALIVAAIYTVKRAQERGAE